MMNYSKEKTPFGKMSKRKIFYRDLLQKVSGKYLRGKINEDVHEVVPSIKKMTLTFGTSLFRRNFVANTNQIIKMYKKSFKLL